MKEVMSFGWDKNEKDKNMTEVSHFFHILPFYTSEH